MSLALRIYDTLHSTIDIIMRHDGSSLQHYCRLKIMSKTHKVHATTFTYTHKHNTRTHIYVRVLATGTIFGKVQVLTCLMTMQIPIHQGCKNK